MARLIPEAGDTVHFDHCWGVVWVNSTRTRPAVVEREGVGLVSRYSSDGRNLLVVDSLGRRYRVPVMHARVVEQKPDQQSLF